MTNYGHLLDASALLAAMANGPGADQVRQCIDHSAIQAVNLAEVKRSRADCICLTVAKEAGQTVVTADRVWSQIPELGVRILQIR